MGNKEPAHLPLLRRIAERFCRDRQELEPSEVTRSLAAWYATVPPDNRRPSSALAWLKVRYARGQAAIELTKWRLWEIEAMKPR